MHSIWNGAGADVDKSGIGELGSAEAVASGVDQAARSGRRGTGACGFGGERKSPRLKPLLCRPLSHGLKAVASTVASRCEA